MRAAGKSANAFAALREESAVLRQKEKKERALERKALVEANAERIHHTVPISVAMTMQHGYSWADISDDDEEDCGTASKLPGKQEENLEAYLSSSDEEASIEEEEGDEEDGNIDRISRVEQFDGDDCYPRLGDGRLNKLQENGTTQGNE